MKSLFGPLLILAVGLGNGEVVKHRKLAGAGPDAHSKPPPARHRFSATSCARSTPASRRLRISRDIRAPFVEFAQVDPRAEILQRLKRAVVSRSTMAAATAVSPTFLIAANP